MYEEIQQRYPQEFALRDQDKYRYRYPKGEVRLHQIICISFELLSQGLMGLHMIARCFSVHLFHVVFVLLFYVPLATNSFYIHFSTLNNHQINVALLAIILRITHQLNTPKWNKQVCFLGCIDIVPKRPN